MGGRRFELTAKVDSDIDLGAVFKGFSGRASDRLPLGLRRQERRGQAQRAPARRQIRRPAAQRADRARGAASEPASSSSSAWSTSCAAGDKDFAVCNRRAAGFRRSTEPIIKYFDAMLAARMPRGRGTCIGIARHDRFRVSRQVRRAGPDEQRSGLCRPSGREAARPVRAGARCRPPLLRRAISPGDGRRPAARLRVPRRPCPRHPCHAVTVVPIGRVRLGGRACRSLSRRSCAALSCCRLSAPMIPRLRPRCSTRPAASSRPGPWSSPASLHLLLQRQGDCPTRGSGSASGTLRHRRLSARPPGARPVIVNRWIREGRFQRRAVIVGGGESAAELIRSLESRERPPRPDLRHLRRPLRRSLAADRPRLSAPRHHRRARRVRAHRQDRHADRLAADHGRERACSRS